MDRQHMPSILFLDIETVSAHQEYDLLSHRMKEQWQRKSKRFLPQGEEPTEEKWSELYSDKAAIMAEFGRIVCISVGFLHEKPNGDWGMRIKSFANTDELTLLTDFAAMLEESFAQRQFQYLCGHNVREFDLPYIGRRILIQGMPLPLPLQLQGKKPWELKHILDTMELWKFGDFKHYTSLDLLSAIFDIPSPKSDIDGSQVGRVFYQEGDLDRIKNYCERDVWVTASVFLRMNQMDYPQDKDVVYV